ncbi:hypothetical protein D8Y20_08725 [Mariprofundus sp. EBB-1]|uniref:PepSY domain-containing protein n=1 Tax=Mariprofundus sp. EBB-1 TaxID=2650971 RepID=UPI000EF26E3A|nr:PepSY domain-containing protein [Mariprofundus sp. EBB-1]RLL51758.1 hypothetical protein D8Y20_08725 [Mariprofundus sp. EBB-1]
MKNKTLMICVISGLIAASPISAIAHDAGNLNEIESKLTDSLKGIPEDVENGSIAVDEDTPKTQLSQLATVGIERAIAIAHQTLQGKIIKSELEEAEDYLVWEVEVIPEKGSPMELKIDAGNGKLLAAEQKEEEAWWQFWD